LWNIKYRLLIGGTVATILGLLIYLTKHFTPVLVLPVIGVVALIVGILYKPKKETEISLE
jgi:membrane protein implicated in regulation of membrane protease activity